MIAAGGPDNLSVRKVSQAAGTSTSAVYSLYGSKESLLQAVYERAARGFAASQVIEFSDDAAQDLLQLSMNYRTWALENPHLYPVMFDGRSGLQNAGAGALGQSTIQPLVAVVQRAIDAGFLRQADAFQVAVALRTSVHGYVMLELAGLLGRHFGGQLATDPDAAYYNYTLVAVTYWATDVERVRSRIKSGGTA